MLPPEKGDSDYDGVDGNDAEDMGQLSAPLKSTPGIGSEGRFFWIQPILGLTQEWLRESSFPRLECGVRDKLQIYPLGVGFLLPLA